LSVATHCRQLHSIISEDGAFAASVLDLVLAMQLAAAGPLWQQMQQEAASQAERYVIVTCCSNGVLDAVTVQ
jgi:hypothetical protein